jgi:hypothetical protein
MVIPVTANHFEMASRDLEKVGWLMVGFPSLIDSVRRRSRYRAIVGLSLFVWASGFVGCGSNSLYNAPPANGGPNSCEMIGINSLCSDFNGSEGQSSCPGNYLTPPSACPTSNIAGSCVTGFTTLHYYTTGATPYTTASAQADCSGSGVTFTPNQ